MPTLSILLLLKNQEQRSSPSGKAARGGGSIRALPVGGGDVSPYFILNFSDNLQGGEKCYED